MTPLAESAVDWGALGDVLWVSVVAGVGVTAAFALTILGGTRAAELRRQGNAAAAGLYGVLMVLAFVVVVAAVVFGIVVMAQKS